MTDFSITSHPAEMPEGPILERATFGLLEIEARGEMLSQALDKRSREALYQTGPYVSAYHLAEWLCWNWWRLRWEPRSSPYTTPSLEWDLAHRMSDAGAGYLWPNITIACDGFHCELTSERSHPLDTPLFSYLGARPVTIPARSFESAVDSFVARVIERLQQSKITDTNLELTWTELLEEREEPHLTRFRKVEALLGRDPDTIDGEIIERWLSEADALGEQALAELATGPDAFMLSAQYIGETSQSNGFDLNPDDRIVVSTPLVDDITGATATWGDLPAWRVGIAAANAVRHEASLGEEPISDRRLTEMAGTHPVVVRDVRSTGSVSWLFSENSRGPRLALRPRFPTGRRFDIARLLGDHLFGQPTLTCNEPLIPATTSYSYRQKAQRAFAAELLSPWETVLAMLGDDRSDEKIGQIAIHFDVSTMAIENLIRNNNGVSRRLRDDTIC